MRVDHIHKRHPLFLSKHIDQEMYFHACLAVHFDVWTCIKMSGKLLVHHACFEPRLHGGKTRSGWKPTTELNIQTRSLSLLFSSSLSRPHSHSLGWLQVALYLIKPSLLPLPGYIASHQHSIIWWRRFPGWGPSVHNSSSVSDALCNDPFHSEALGCIVNIF